ncbi:MAG: excinuclease ABC subunit UvrA [Spirochaetaceae bacterium]|nr:MAG: excinuclease ABC subunit UvrA [Spirochaetaceae bacterium]
MNSIRIRGAREHNLKNINVDLPRDHFIVITGMSGSGKSSLAFDTLFAEGQRRYVESLSAYARQFLGRLDKPDIDYIEGLSPAISIEQKTTNRNPRSTVGTVTEIHDYLRLLYARIGTPHDPTTGAVIEKQSIDEIVDRILAADEGTKLQILSPVVQSRKGTHKRVIDNARQAGFTRVRVNGEFKSVEDDIDLEKNRRHSIDIVVDRIKIRNGQQNRVSQSVETALELSGGTVRVFYQRDDGDHEDVYNQNYAYTDSDIVFPELEPRLFSFNNPHGACHVCDGLGMSMTFDREKLVPDTSLSFLDGGLAAYNPNSSWHRSRFESLAEHYGFSLDTPFSELSPEIQEMLFSGSADSLQVKVENDSGSSTFEYSMQFPGMIQDLERRYRESSSDGVREWLETFMSRTPCHACQGQRLRPEALAVKIGDKGIHEVSTLSIAECVHFFDSLRLTPTESTIAGEVIREIRERLGFLLSVGLGYLSLNRQAATLSGGESQRIRLATQIGSSLVGVLYILDEPTIGLHQRDNERLIGTLKRLRDLGNTLVIVEHDEQTIRSADHIVDMGPRAGVHGGQIVAQGTLAEILASEDSPTGRYLSGKDRMQPPDTRRNGNGSFLRIEGCALNNLKNIDVSIPLGTMIAITGVSGSGKSSLMTGTLYPALARALNKAQITGGPIGTIQGLEALDKVIQIDQQPIGRTPRSNPATYVGLYGMIRDLFAALPESRSRGYKPGRFSFNVKGGRCEHCQGAGTIKIEMHFLSDVYVTCDVCDGKRFNRETLEVHYKGKSIHDILELTVEEAEAFFSAVPNVRRKLETLSAVGLEYVKLGQSALTLSGGEAQRVKLALELSKRSTGKTIYVLDEPTTGLHFTDIRKLLQVLHQIVEEGNTVVLIEHNLDVIAAADYVVDLGPEGGDRGGHVIATGTPEQIARVEESHTGRFLRDTLRMVI